MRFFKYSQDTPEHTVRDELANHTWQFDAATVAKMLSPKTRKSPFDPHDIDTLDDYDIPKIDADVLKQAADSLKSTPKLPKLKTESRLYSPLCVFLNHCVQVCRQALNLEDGYYDDLNFIVWNHPMVDDIAGIKPLKPHLAGGKSLPKSEIIIKAAGLYWQPPSSSDHQLLIPVELKNNWPDLVCQAGMDAYCLFNVSPLRQFALALGYNHIQQEFRFLIFHRGGLTSSLPLNPNSKTDRLDILRIFLAILSWKTPAHAGFPTWCNDSEMELPANATGDESIRVQVKKVLSQNPCIRGRASHVSLVSIPDASQTKSPPD